MDRARVSIFFIYCEGVIVQLFPGFPAAKDLFVPKRAQWGPVVGKRKGDLGNPDPNAHSFFQGDLGPAALSITHLTGLWLW